MPRPIEIPILTAQEVQALEKLYRTTRDVRVRTRVQIILLAGEQRLTAPAVTKIVRKDDEVEEVVRAAAGRLVLLYLPTYSPWLNPIEMLWRHFRREVTHCELFETKQALLVAAQNFFDRYEQCPEKIRSAVGSRHLTEQVLPIEHNLVRKTVNLPSSWNSLNNKCR